jgi:dolichol kinase
MKKKESKETKKLETRRQLFHLVTGILIVILLYFEIMPIWLFFIIMITGIIVYNAWEKEANPIFAWFFRHFERKEEREGTGALWYAIGCFITALLFEKNVALAAILILAGGDSVSHWVGRFYGRIPHPLNKKKNVEGTVAGIIAAFGAAVFFVPNLPAFIASVIIMNMEVFDWKLFGRRIDDNFWIPIVAALIITGVSLL